MVDGVATPSNIDNNYLHFAFNQLSITYELKVKE